MGETVFTGCLAIIGFVPEGSFLMPAIIFMARIVDVSIGTLRLICITRGRRRLAVVLGFFEVTIWLLAVSGVFAHLDNWMNFLAFAGGFTVGNAVGMAIERKLAMGTQVVHFLSRGGAHAVAERLRFADYIVTTFLGQGRDGPVAACMAIIPRKQTRKVVQMAREVDPAVIVTVEEVAETSISAPAVPFTPFDRLGGLAKIGNLFPGTSRGSAKLAAPTSVTVSGGTAQTAGPCAAAPTTSAWTVTTTAMGPVSDSEPGSTPVVAAPLEAPAPSAA